MTDERIPDLQALFDAARTTQEDNAFVTRVTSAIERDRRRTLFGWVAAAVLLAPVAWWLVGPVMKIVSLVSQLLPDSLVEVETTWLAALTAPINSVGFAVGAVFLLAWWFARKLRR
jgi:hypothetical protein